MALAQGGEPGEHLVLGGLEPLRQRGIRRVGHGEFGLDEVEKLLVQLIEVAHDRHSIAMELRPLGGTAALVSPLGLGLAALGRPGYITIGHGGDMPLHRDVAAMETRCHEVLDAAWESGIRYVDAARSYGLAEQFLASWLARRGLVRGALAIGTKWGYTYTAGWKVDAAQHEVKDLSVSTLRRQVAESRALLGDHVQLLQIHSATIESGVLDDADVIAELARLRDGGLAIGLTVTGAEQAVAVRRALELDPGGRRLFACVQATWNLLERSAEPALAAAHAAGLAVIVKEAVANGRLAGGEVPQPLRDAASRLGVTTDALAIAAALSRPWVGVVLSGAATVAQLRANLAALAVLYTDELDAELQPVVEPPRAYWAARSALPWN